MRVLLLTAFCMLCFAEGIVAQRNCTSAAYEQQIMANQPELAAKRSEIENFIRRQQDAPTAARTFGKAEIIIPVVVHVLYNKDAENISDERIHQQIAVLNQCFRRDNPDSTKTPQRFLSLAADCKIEFKLAISDPKSRATTGIVRKYTPVTQWDADDNMKFSSKAGDDAWDTDSYLNIWVVNLKRAAGYSSFPGGPAEKDGLVISYTAFGLSGNTGYEMGKTAVHETGHWLGLRHIWGDMYCGDDWVDDTPKQATFTSGCPSGIRVSCTNGPDGDMYMNYMDLTYDACINLFTEGQKQRMLALFKPGGARYAMHSSKALLPPTNSEIPLPDERPRFDFPVVYPNPVQAELTLDFSSDIRWIGQVISITNLQGIVMMQVTVTNKIQKVPVSQLRPGLYLLTGKKDDGVAIKNKFIKM